MILARKFAVRLKETIKGKGLQLKVVAYRSGYNEQYIRRVYNNPGKSNPTICFIEAMAAALDVSVAFLLSLEDENAE